MGIGKSAAMTSGMEAVANEAAMKSSQPHIAVKPTPATIAIGATRAAPVVSSER